MTVVGIAEEAVGQTPSVITTNVYAKMDLETATTTREMVAKRVSQTTIVTVENATISAGIIWSVRTRNVNV
jgi:hypothetical protein